MLDKKIRKEKKNRNGPKNLENRYPQFVGSNDQNQKNYAKDVNHYS